MEEIKIEYFFKNIEQFRFKDIFKDCIYPWEVVNKINQFINGFMKNDSMQINKAQVGKFCSIEGNYFIDEGTKIGSNVCIQGPVIIGKNVEIQSGALIRPGSIIGDNCSVGHGSEIKHSILQNKAKVASLAFVGDSILGTSTRIGSGVILANRRFDQKNITVKIKKEKVDTGTDFFGSIIGDSSRLGANAVSLPGTLIGPYTWILPGVQARGFIEAQKRVFPVTEYIITENPKIELK